MINSPGMLLASDGVAAKKPQWKKEKKKKRRETLQPLEPTHIIFA